MPAVHTAPSSDTEPRTADRFAARWGHCAIIVAVATGVLIPHALWFNFVNDDAYISFRYARNLAEHGQLVFNLGERVEGYTNFLWTVILALFIKLGVTPEISARVLGLGFGIGGLVMVTLIARHLDAGRTRAVHAIAPLGLAASSAYACWCMGGLETQMFTFLFLLASWRLLHEMEAGTGQASAAVFALLAMTRPEGALLFGLAATFRLGCTIVSQRRVLPLRQEILWLGLFVLLFLPYFIWRWRYYGWPFPNTFYVKSTGGGAGLSMGLYYLRRFAEDHMLYFVGPFILAGWWVGAGRGDRRRRYFVAYATLIATVFAAYTAKVGGDFMGLYRFVMILLPLGALLVQESARALAARLAITVGRPILAVAGLLLTAGYAVASVHTSRISMSFIGADRGIDSPGYLKHYVDERIPIGHWFAQHARPDDLMTVGGAGVIAYYSGIAAYDVFGLVDETIAHDPAMSSGQQRPGHQKWGSDEYMISRRPTLITHHYRIHAHHAPNADLWRARGYEWVTATIPDLAHPPLYSFLKRTDRAFGPFPATTAPDPDLDLR